MGWNPVNDAKKAAEKEARKVIDKVLKPAIDAGKKAVYDGSKWARDAIRKVQRECEAALKRTGNEIEDGFQKVAGLPEGVVVEPGRIEVRFTGAREAVVRLFALAQALTNDYERFETLVGKGERSG